PRGAERSLRARQRHRGVVVGCRSAHSSDLPSLSSERGERRPDASGGLRLGALASMAATAFRWPARPARALHAQRPSDSVSLVSSRVAATGGALARAPAALGEGTACAATGERAVRLSRRPEPRAGDLPALPRHPGAGDLDQWAVPG